MKKFHFIFDKTQKAQNYKKKLLEKIKNVSPSKSFCIVVFGGDGFYVEDLAKILQIQKTLLWY